MHEQQTKVAQVTNLDSRYVVLKTTDLNQVAPILQNQLNDIRRAVTDVRLTRHRQASYAEVDALVIEKDWPEYEPTKAALLKRINGQEDPAQDQSNVQHEIDVMYDRIKDAEGDLYDAGLLLTEDQLENIITLSIKYGELCAKRDLAKNN